MMFNWFRNLWTRATPRSPSPQYLPLLREGMPDLTAQQRWELRYMQQLTNEDLDAQLYRGLSVGLDLDEVLRILRLGARW